MLGLFRPVIAWLLAGLSKLFASRLGSWFAQALLFLGIQFVVQNYGAEAIMSEIEAAMAGVGGAAVPWLAFLNIDKYLSCIVSAYGVVVSKRLILQRRV